MNEYMNDFGPNASTPGTLGDGDARQSDVVGN